MQRKAWRVCEWAAYDAALLSDGKLLVTGRGFAETTGTDFSWLRLAP